MKNRAVAIVAVVAFLASSACLAWGQKGAVKVEPEDQLAKYLPATVFLDGENVPTQKRNAVLLNIDGKKTIVSLVDTGGYSSGYQEKYIGVILTQEPIMLGSKTLPAGAYGFGETKTGSHDNEKVTVHVYNIGGKEVEQIPTAHEKTLRGVRPLQVIAGSNGEAQLYLGLNHTSIGPAK